LFTYVWVQGAGFWQQSLQFLLLAKSSHALHQFMDMARKLLDDLDQVRQLLESVQSDYSLTGIFAVQIYG
jgi:hypothetical protein